MTDVLRGQLRELGVPEDEIEAAAGAGTLPRLAIDRVLLPGVRRYDRDEVASLVHVEEESARRLWRALGFSDVAAGEKLFTEADIEALRIAKDLVDQGLADPHVMIQLTRVVGSAMARVAEAFVAVMEERLRPLVDAGGLTAEDTAGVVAAVVAELRPQWLRLLGYVYDRHLHAVLQRTMTLEGEPSNTRVMAVGFADLVGFTALSQQLDERELAELVDRFEEVAYDTVVARGGRVVKVVGDEVMFVSDDPRSAAEIGLEMADAYADDETLSDVRVGLAFGDVLPHDGDYFGPVVNLASRIMNVAYAGAVVASEEVYRAIGDDPSFGWKPIRPRRLKGIGWTPLWVLTRPGEGRPVATEVARRVRARRNQSRAGRLRPEPDEPPPARSAVRPRRVATAHGGPSQAGRRAGRGGGPQGRGGAHARAPRAGADGRGSLRGR